MNESNDFQTYLEQLEAGTPLADLLPALPPEEAALLSLADALKRLESPVPAAQQVAAQRQALLQLAQDRRATAVKPPWWQLAAAWIRGHRPLAAAVGALALLLLVWGLLARAAKPAAVAGDPAADLAAAPAGRDAQPAPPTAIPVTAPESELAAAALAFGAYLPAVEVAAVPDAASTGLQAPVGLVEVQALDGGWTAVSRAAVLQPGQHVRTGRLSSAQLQFYDGSLAAIGPETEIVLETVSAQPAAAGFRTVVLTLLYGESTHHVRFRNDGGSRYEVRTPTGSGIARGTQFDVRVSQDGGARFAVDEGRVDVTNANQTVQVQAGALTTFAAAEPPSPPVFRTVGEGIVSAMGDTWIIAGQAFAVTADTEIIGEPQLGDRVRVDGTLRPEGAPIASRITLQGPAVETQFRLAGVVEAIGPAAWTVAGQLIQVTSDTIIDSRTAVGDSVRVSGQVLADGRLQAEAITRLADRPAFPFEFTGIVQAIADDAWRISGVTVAVNADTEIDAGIGVGDLVSVEGVILPGGRWLATEIRLRGPIGQGRFVLTGEVSHIDPWIVAGVPLAVRPWSLIDDGIAVGDQVRVRGIIAADGTWIAAEIVSLEDADDGLLRIGFVGTVDSIDPWIVNGLPLVVDGSTVIDPGIAVGDWVRVTVVVRADGTWLAQRIKRLDVTVDPGCVTITALILGIRGDELVLGNGQTIRLDEEVVVSGDLRAGSIVLTVACVNADGSITIVSITLLYDPGDPPPPPPPPPGGGGQITICHKPGTPAEKSMTVPESALSGHLGHGDRRGACP